MPHINCKYHWEYNIATLLEDIIIYKHGQALEANFNVCKHTKVLTPKRVQVEK